MADRAVLARILCRFLHLRQFVLTMTNSARRRRKSASLEKTNSDGNISADMTDSDVSSQSKSSMHSQRTSPKKLNRAATSEIKQKINWRCDPKKIVDMIAELSPQQLKWVVELGFGSLTEMIDCHLPRKLTIWLIKQVACHSKSIVFRNRKVSIVDAVENLLKLPALDKEVPMPRPGCVRDKPFRGNTEFKSDKAGRGESLKAAKQRMLQYTEEKDRDKFCICFMEVIMCAYLAPTTGYQINRSYLLRALKDNLITRIKKLEDHYLSKRQKLTTFFKRKLEIKLQELENQKIKDMAALVQEEIDKAMVLMIHAAPAPSVQRSDDPTSKTSSIGTESPSNSNLDDNLLVTSKSADCAPEITSHGDVNKVFTMDSQKSPSFLTETSQIGTDASQKATKLLETQRVTDDNFRPCSSIKELTHNDQITDDEPAACKDQIEQTGGTSPTFHAETNVDAPTPANDRIIQSDNSSKLGPPIGTQQSMHLSGNTKEGTGANVPLMTITSPSVLQLHFSSAGN